MSSSIFYNPTFYYDESILLRKQSFFNPFRAANRRPPSGRLWIACKISLNGSSNQALVIPVKKESFSSTSISLPSETFGDKNLHPNTDPLSIKEWEMDFFPRPILDGNGNKMWELLICDSRRKLHFARFYPSDAVSSLTVKNAIICLMNSLNLPKPQKIRFFRPQAEAIISRACNEVDIQAVPSRRCVSLICWLNERHDAVYQQHPGFVGGSLAPLQVAQSFPIELADSLRGEKWAFVHLPLQEIVSVEEVSVFGSSSSLDALGLSLPNNTVIPGLAVASSRATPLAAWTNTLELASLHIDRRKGCIVLSTGINERWLYAVYRRSQKADQEAEAWQATKKACGGLHFLAIQKSLDSESCTGFWLLFDGPLPRV